MARPHPSYAQPSPLHDAFELTAGQIDDEPAAVQQPFGDDFAEEPAENSFVPPPRPTSNRRTPRDDSPSAESRDQTPPQKFEGRLPLAGSQAGDDVQMSQTRDGRITLKVRDASLSKVLALLAQAHGLNIVASNDIDAMISITLNDVPLEEALTAILSVANYTWVQRNNIILITSLTDSANLPAGVQGRQIQVFELDFASAQIVAEAISGFLSPIGKVSISESDPADNRLTRELVVVEDLPDSLARISAYIYQVDRPPRQVLIEAHVLQVTLDDTNRQGVNLKQLLRLSKAADLTIQTPGFSNEDASPAFIATLTGADLDSVIELLQSTTDAKTLGSPKVLVLNEQKARLQVGDQLGFKVTTTTETSTLESVQFLDVGVILDIVPRITRDGRVLLHVEPEVSTGEVNPDTGLPEQSTTELSTDVMLCDGQGMVIGGLIQETDSVTQSKIPYLGDVKGLGWFFRRSEVTKERAEIIVALIPRVQPYSPEWQAYEQGELIKSGVPLMQGPLKRTWRPWDPVLPDGDRIYRPLLPRRGEIRHHWKKGHDPAVYNPWTDQYVVPPRPLPQPRIYNYDFDPTIAPQEAMQPQDGFLSDDLEPLPQPGGNSWYGPEVITDQQ